MNKRYYEHTLPIIRGSLSNTYERKKKIMSNFATDSCHNLFQPGCTFYLHGFSGGTRRDTGCLFPFHFHNHLSTKSIIK